MKTGEERELILDQNIATDWGTLGQLGWSPDGRYVLFTVGKFSSDEQSDGMVQLWRISAEGGIPQKVLEIEREKCSHYIFAL